MRRTSTSFPVHAALLALVLMACSPDTGPADPLRGAGRWVRVASTTEANLNAVWGSGPQDVWVVGDNGNRNGTVGTALHWDGVEWHDVELPRHTSCGPGSCGLRCVWGSGPNDVWAAGVDRLAGAPSPVLRWNGAAWSSVPDDPTGNAPEASRGWYDCGRGVGDEIWLAGSDDSLARWDGVRWRTDGTGMVGMYGLYPYARGHLAGFWRSGADEVWLVGQAPSISPAAPGLISRWDRSGWQESAFTLAYLEGVWGAGANDVWVVGHEGTILRWDGREWTESPSDSSATLRAIWGSSATDVWTVGDSGVTLHWDGHSWSAVSSGACTTLRALWGSNPADVWAVGDEGTILHWSP